MHIVYVYTSAAELTFFFVWLFFRAMILIFHIYIYVHACFFIRLFVLFVSFVFCFFILFSLSGKSVRSHGGVQSRGRPVRGPRLRPRQRAVRKVRYTHTHNAVVPTAFTIIWGLRKIGSTSVLKPYDGVVTHLSFPQFFPIYSQFVFPNSHFFFQLSKFPNFPNCMYIQ